MIYVHVFVAVQENQTAILEENLQKAQGVQTAVRAELSAEHQEKERLVDQVSKGID
jgi:hypothetical protein